MQETGEDGMIDLDPKAIALGVASAFGSFAAMVQRYLSRFDDYSVREAVGDFLLTIFLAVPVGTIAGYQVIRTIAPDGELKIPLDDPAVLAGLGCAIFIGTATRDIAAAKKTDIVKAVLRFVSGGRL